MLLTALRYLRYLRSCDRAWRSRHACDEDIGRHLRRLRAARAQHGFGATVDPARRLAVQSANASAAAAPQNRSARGAADGCADPPGLSAAGATLVRRADQDLSRRCRRRWARSGRARGLFAGLRQPRLGPVFINPTENPMSAASEQSGSGLNGPRLLFLTPSGHFRLSITLKAQARPAPLLRDRENLARREERLRSCRSLCLENSDEVPPVNSRPTIYRQGDHT